MAPGNFLQSRRGSTRVNDGTSDYRQSFWPLPARDSATGAMAAAGHPLATVRGAAHAAMDAAIVAMTMAAIAVAPLADAASYYFSSLGSDATGNGSLESPWNSINRFNQLTLTPGDSPLFHAGDTFPGVMWLDSTDGGINAAGNFVAPVTIGSSAPG